MYNKNKLTGVILILLGVSLSLGKSDIEVGSILMLFIGLGLLYAYYIRREQPFIILGGVFSVIGLLFILKDIRLIRINIAFETTFIMLGIMLLYVYRTKHIHGFIFPGMILPAVGVYLILLKYFDGRYAASSIFLLLGFAFYAIYFIEYMDKSCWPLIPATLLLLIGIFSYAIRFNIITWRMIYIKKDFIWPLIMIAAGIFILPKKQKKQK